MCIASQASDNDGTMETMALELTDVMANLKSYVSKARPYTDLR